MAALAAACAPATPSPTAQPEKPAASPAAKAELKPVPSPAEGPPPEWEATVAAAKQEGKVNVVGPVGDESRDLLVLGFQQQFGIPVEYWSAQGNDIPPRVSTERNAGQYLRDVYIGGVTTGLTSMIPMGAFDPIEPAMILPDVKTLRSGAVGSSSSQSRS